MHDDRESARQTLFDASTLSRLRAAKDSALSVGADARAVGELSGASAGIAYLRAVSAEETVRAREADSDEAVGILTHHLVHDETAWLFLEGLFAATVAHPACRWVSIREFI